MVYLSYHVGGIAEAVLPAYEAPPAVIVLEIRQRPVRRADPQPSVAGTEQAADVVGVGIVEFRGVAVVRRPEQRKAVVGSRVHRQSVAVRAHPYSAVVSLLERMDSRRQRPPRDPCGHHLVVYVDPAVFRPYVVEPSAGAVDRDDAVPGRRFGVPLHRQYMEQRVVPACPLEPAQASGDPQYVLVVAQERAEAVLGAPVALCSLVIEGDEIPRSTVETSEAAASGVQP